MMIVEFENEAMTDFIPFKAIQVEAQDPDIEDKYANSSPSWKIARKNSISLYALPSIDNDEDQCP